MQKATQIAKTGMVVSGLLATLKIGIGLAAHSAAVTADGFESAADILTSGLVLIGITIAARPADDARSSSLSPAPERASIECRV